MQRDIMGRLVGWKGSQRRKPLLLQGARQVGKTWAIKELARSEFEGMAYVDFQAAENMHAVFEGSLDPARLLDAVALQTGAEAGDPRVLVVFDEVQECPRALESLKSFQQERPDVPLVAAGSLLGVALHGRGREVSFPVGKVDHLMMHPMTFAEYLRGTGQGRLATLLESGDESLIGAFSERLTDELRRYYFVGGMPEAVSTFAETRDYTAVRVVQSRLLTDYELDFSKYASAQLTERIRLVWRSLPGQLARENKKFLYSAVKTGARARGYEEAIQWLVDAGLVHKVTRISKPGLPLSAYEDLAAFKLYFLDVGLLGAASRLDASTIVEGSRLFTEFKGALTENYVCQSLVATEKVEPRYWSAENSTGEVDFVYDYAGRVVAVEAKAELNLRAKSLRTFVERNGLEPGVRLSLAGFDRQGWVVNVPLYAAGLLPDRIHGTRPPADLDGLGIRPESLHAGCSDSY